MNFEWHWAFYSVSSANMGAIRCITRTSFFWTHENYLSNQILELHCWWSFLITHLFYFFLPSIMFVMFSLLKTSHLFFFLEMANMTREFCDSKYHWFINNIINMKFDCPADKICEITKNVILLAFSMFLFFLQNSYYYSIFYFLYFCI